MSSLQPSSEAPLCQSGREDTLQDQLQLAVLLARSRHTAEARLICDDLAARWLVTIAADPALLAGLISAMFQAQAYQQLRRLLKATCGEEVCFRPVCGRTLRPGIHSLPVGGQDGVTVTFNDDTHRDVAGLALVERWASAAAAGHLRGPLAGFPSGDEHPAQARQPLLVAAAE